MSGFLPQKSRKEILKKKQKISIVVPLYNERESLLPLHDEISSVCQSHRWDYEIIYVDDGSTDGSFEILEKLYRQNPRRVRVVQFRRNFGKAEALSSGFRMAKGEFVVTLDADLQDDPKEIPKLIGKLQEGFDLVSGWKVHRKDPLSKRLPSKLFNRVTAWLSGIPLHDFNCGLKVYRIEVAKTLQIYGELHRYIPVLAHWYGFRVTEMPVHHRPRKFGKSKYGFSRFLRGGLDLVTVLFFGKYTKRPLHLFGSLGLLFTLLGGGITAYLIVLRITRTIFLSNRPLLFFGIVLLILGIQFISIGLLGEMIARSRPTEPQEVIRKTLGE